MNGPAMLEIEPRRIVAPPRNPYYIVAPHYIRTSAGIKAMHLLCHALNGMGQRAYMVIWPFIHYLSPTHPDLLTPLLTEDAINVDLQRGLTPITVYPETIAGNPLNAPFVVRYVMNFPGLLGGEKQFEPGELCFGYSALLAEAVGAPENVLFIPASDPELFKPEPRAARRGTCFFAGKYKNFHGGELSRITADSMEITRDQPDSQSPLEIAELFRRSELFYCYENSALAIEALLCECPVVFLPNPYLKDIIASKEFGLDGCAWGAEPREIERAKATVAQGRMNYLRTFEEFWLQLEQFIDTTQAGARMIRYQRSLDTKRINRSTRFDDLARLSRAAVSVLRTHGWKAFFRKSARKISRVVTGTRESPQPRW